MRETIQEMTREEKDVAITATLMPTRRKGTFTTGKKHKQQIRKQNQQDYFFQGTVHAQLILRSEM